MPAWDEIKTILLDMDGTLLDLNFDTQFWQEYVPRRYAFTRGLDINTAKNILTPCFKKNEGSLNWYCLDFWSQKLGLNIAEMKRDIAHLIAIKDDAVEFLTTLRKTGKHTVLVTNAHPDSLALKLEHTRLDNNLDRIISAHELGLPKENNLFWHQLQQIEPFAPHKTLLIDDSLPVLRSAKSFGIRHLLAACHPDSRKAPHSTDEFAFFHSFTEITPPIYPSA